MIKTEISEAHLRDTLALNLSVIEPGLRLVKVNYHLPNSRGTRGFIDILAIDSAGVLVVLELKRSDNTAREAIHEVLKYGQLLQNERGISTDRLRLMIVSTSWKELLVPFSVAARTSEIPLVGKSIVVRPNPPIGIESVHDIEILPTPPDRGLSTVAIQVAVTDGVQISTLWRTVVESISEGGVDDAIGILLEREKDGRALHVALGTVVPGDPRALDLMSKSEDSAAERYEFDSLAALVAPEEDFNDEEYQDEADEEGMASVEENLDCELAAAGLCLRQTGGTIASPDRLLRLEEVGWEVVKILTAGCYAQQADLLSDEHAKDLARGLSGGSQVKFCDRARPEHPVAWRRFRQQLRQVLFNIQDWQGPVDQWLDEFPGDGLWQVEAGAYAPSDFLAFWIWSGPSTRLSEYLPDLQISARDISNPSVGRDLKGYLSWNGLIVDIEDEFRSIFAHDSNYWLARTTGGLWRMDSELLRKVGLTYSLAELPFGEDEVRMLRAGDGSLERTTFGPPDERSDHRPLSQFLDVHHSALERLGSRLRIGLESADSFGTYVYKDSPASS